MNLLIFVLLFATICFAIGLLIFSLKEEKIKKLLIERERKQKHRLYEISTLKEIQDRIGYSLEVEKIIDVIIGSLRNLFTYSTASSLVIKDGKLIFKTFVEESISHHYINQVKKSMLASLSALSDHPLPPEKDILETVSGASLNEDNMNMPASFFHIPLVVNEKVVGVINISSTTPGLYKEEEMIILYQITNQASLALTRLQRLLDAEKGKLISMIKSLPDSVFMVDTFHNLVIINDNAKKLLGIQSDHPSTTDILIAIEHSNHISDYINMAIAEKKEMREENVKIGNQTLEMVVTPVIDPNQATIIGVSVCLHDNTPEQELLQAKEDFTNMVVHELRAPMTVIKDAANLVINGHGRMDEAQQAKLLTMIHDQAKRMLEDISLVLDAAKLKAGKFEVQKEPTDIAKLAEEHIAVFKSQAQEKNIELEVHIQPHINPIFIDPLRIGQVFNNLISNSLKYTHNGGRIIVTINGPHTGNDVLTVSIEDTGIGIPQEKQAALFQKFAQVTPSKLSHEDGASEKKQNSTGLGLYIVKGIIEGHGGTISLTSQPDKGTKITFTLPYEMPLHSFPSHELFYQQTVATHLPKVVN